MANATISVGEFNNHYKPTGTGSIYTGTLDALQVLQPISIDVGNANPDQRRSAFCGAARARWGTGRVRTTIVHGVVFACLMPAAETNGA